VVGGLGLADRDPLVAPAQRRAVTPAEAGKSCSGTAPAGTRGAGRKQRRAEQRALEADAWREADATAMAAFAETLPHRFARLELLAEALTHRSAADASRRQLDSNERLEFLGDRVLALLMAEWLSERFPEEREGDLGKRLAKLVSAESLAQVAAGMNLGAALRVPPAERRAGVGARPSVLADAVEALLGALYLDGGLDPARKLVRREWSALLDACAKPPVSAKQRLQEWLGRRGLGLPEYLLLSAEGPSHSPVFHVRVLAAGRDAEGHGETKRAAEQVAAARLLAVLGA
jgi:ribonuclease-3